MRNNDVSGLSTRELSAEVEKYKNKYEQLTMLLEEEKSKNAESASLESQVEELKRFAAMLNDDYNKVLKEKAEAIKEHQSEMKKLTADRDKQINSLNIAICCKSVLNSSGCLSQSIMIIDHKQCAVVV